MKEIYIYTSINDYSAIQFITDLENNKGNAVKCRMNTPGGSVYSAYGMVAKWAEHPKGKTIHVDGRADSGGAFMCCYADSVECLDVSTFLFHRAALPSWVESNPDYFTDEAKAELTQINTNLRAAMEGKFTSAKFFKVTGVSLDAMFSLEDRLDVVINADQALELGLVSKINKITPEKATAINAMAMRIAAETNSATATVTVPQTKNSNTNNNPMKEIKTLADFKAQYPEIYADAIKEGATAEQERVAMWMEWNDVDPAAVSKGIKEGKELTRVQQNEFGKKMLAKQGAAAINEDGAAVPEVNVDPTASQKKPETAAVTAEKDFWATVRKNAGLK